MVEKVKKTTKKVAVKTVKPAETKIAGVSAKVYDMSGKAAGSITLPGEMFGAKINPTLMAQAVRVYLFSQRRGMASSKTRGEVNGTTKKIYRQKGTGRARHGAAKAPIFVGGGITFGPKPRDFSLELPKKMKKKALFSALTAKLQEDKIKIVDFKDAAGRTQEITKTLKSLELMSKKGEVKKLMVIVDAGAGNVLRASRNIKGATVQNVGNLTTYEIVNSNNLLFAKSSIEGLSKTFLKVKAE